MFIQIRRDHYQTMLQRVQGQLPEEACGLLAGLNNTSMWVYPIENELHSSTRFRMEPQEQLNALLDIDLKGWDLLAIYHSHPRGPELPSETDILEHFYPDTLCLIWSGGESGWTCRAYQIQNGALAHIEIRYVE